MVLTTGPLAALDDERRKIDHFWGWGGADDERIEPSAAAFVHELTLTIDGRQVEIPSRAYVDLTDLRLNCYHFLWQHGDVIFLWLEGADAGEGYLVKFTIKDHRVTKREIWHGEFPEIPPEVLSLQQ